MAITSTKVRNLQRKLYLASKQKDGYRFYSLYDKIYRKDILVEAYRQSKANKEAPGVDGISFKDIEDQGVDKFLEDISKELKLNTYRPGPIRRVEIPKPDGGFRSLGIAKIKDRVVATACKIVIEPIFEAHLYEGSFGYRPKKRAQDAIMKINQFLHQGYRHIFDADLSKYFDTIPHSGILGKFSERISDQKVISLIKRMLKSSIQIAEKSGKKRYIASKIGVPQGNVLSPLAANIYLNDFCLLIANKTPCKIIAFADDLVIMHKKAFTKTQYDWIAEQLGRLGLKLNTKKTKLVDMNKMGAHFEFLGFSFKKVKGFIKGTKYIKFQPSNKSQRKLKDAIRNIVKHRTSLTLDELITKVNPILRGWWNYFHSIGYPRQVFFKMDWFVAARFYRWSKGLSQRKGKYLSQDAWAKLKAKGLFLMQPALGKSL